MYSYNENGFTLIELLVSVIIIGVLASLSVANYQSFKERAYFAELQKMHRDMRVAAITIQSLTPPGEVGASINHVNGTNWNGVTTEGSFPVDLNLSIEEFLPGIINTTKFAWSFQVLSGSTAASKSIISWISHCSLDEDTVNTSYFSESTSGQIDYSYSATLTYCI